MSAHSLPEHDELPELRRLLDDHFKTPELARVLGIDDSRALELARRSLLAPLADLLARPGKEIRSRLVEHAFHIARGSAPCMCARLPPELPQLVEMLHAGSLVVDDIEDDAVTRRGAPALHRTWGVPIALNAGNWLYFWPILILSGLPLDRGTSLGIHRRIATTLVRCHQGQALDLALRVHDLRQEEVAPAVSATTRLKTGSLLELSAAIGAIAAHATPDVERALATFGREIGVALQMLDDLGSILSPSKRAKGHEDLVGGRPTWPWAWLSEELEAAAFRTLQRASALAQTQQRTELLHEMMRPQLEFARKKPREHLARAIETLRDAVGDSPAFAALEKDIRTMESSYA
jgi:geranylgeranyl pyrophosphate synthase